MTHVYAVHVLDSLLDYCQTELFASFEDAQKAYDAFLEDCQHDIKHVHSQVSNKDSKSLISYDFIYFEGSESNIKILIEKIQIK